MPHPAITLSVTALKLDWLPDSPHSSFTGKVTFWLQQDTKTGLFTGTAEVLTLDARGCGDRIQAILTEEKLLKVLIGLKLDAETFYNVIVKLFKAWWIRK